MRKTNRSWGKWLAAMLMLFLAASSGCAPRVAYVRGTSEAVPLHDGQTVTIPAGWTGAWMLSDEALADLLMQLEACKKQ